MRALAEKRGSESGGSLRLCGLRASRDFRWNLVVRLFWSTLNLSLRIIGRAASTALIASPTYSGGSSNRGSSRGNGGSYKCNGGSGIRNGNSGGNGSGRTGGRNGRSGSGNRGTGRGNGSGNKR